MPLKKKKKGLVSQNTIKQTSHCVGILCTPGHSHQDLPSDSDDKGKFGFSWHIVVSNFASHATEADFTLVHLLVLLVILFSPFVDQLPGHLSCLRRPKGDTRVKCCAWRGKMPTT